MVFIGVCFLKYVFDIFEITKVSLYEKKKKKQFQLFTISVHFSETCFFLFFQLFFDYPQENKRNMIGFFRFFFKFCLVDAFLLIYDKHFKRIARMFLKSLVYRFSISKIYFIYVTHTNIQRNLSSYKSLMCC